MSKEPSARLLAMRARNEPREITLTQGDTMLIRPVKLQNLVMSGSIPLTLVKKMETTQRTAAGGFSLEDAIKMTDVINAVVMAAAVDPPVTAEATDVSMGLEEIDFEDKIVIFTEANRDAADVAGFPGEHDGRDAPEPAGGEVREAAE